MSSDKKPARKGGAERFLAPKGTNDVFPPESKRWENLIVAFVEIVERAGYGLIQGPMFEDLGVFRRMGEGTDVVRKEMYDFLDKGDPPQHLALRPEGTASVCRAFVEHRPALLPWKVWYASPNFRYESPQAHRYRQHHQLGIEAIGTPDPDLDVEAMTLLHDFYRSIGLTDIDVVLNSIGTPADRSAYIDRLRAFLRDHLDALDPEDQAKVEGHPMRVLDTKRDKSLPVVEEAPKLVEDLSDDALARFERVQSGLRAAGIAFRIDPRLVRGLDYYTHTAFEFQSLGIGGSKSTVGGGGRYDGLIESLGGPPTPGIGFGTGIERVLAACDAEGVFPAPEQRVDVFVIDLTGGDQARDLVTELRRAGVSADRGFDQRSMKSQIKSADRSTARFAAIIGPDEAAAGIVTVRDLRRDTGQATVPRDQLVEHLRLLF
ncbi:MAG: histidine--tRNA ligase [Actinobacteria bacterium]|nr:histidine--tRNA ligase [Actinomycetota bacterium]